MATVSNALRVSSMVMGLIGMVGVGAKAQSTDLFVSLGSTNPGLVREWTASGSLVTTFVNDTVGGLNDPLGLRFGPDGNLYVASYNTNSIKTYNGTTGAYIGEAAASVGYPTDLDFDKHGNMYVADVFNNKVYRVSLASHTVVQTYTGFVNPIGVLVKPDGNILVSNNNGASISELDPLSGLSTVFASGMVTPEGIALGPDGRYYVSGIDNGHSVVVIPASGGSYSMFAANIAPGGSAFDVFSGGNLYVTGDQHVSEIDGTTGAVIGGFDTGYRNTSGIAVRNSDISTPEPGICALASCLASTGLLLSRRRRRGRQRR